MLSIYQISGFLKWSLDFLLKSHDFIATQKKSRELFRRPLYFYVFWDSESKVKVKMAPYPISFGDNLKKSYFRVYNRKIWYHHGFPAAEFNNEVRLDILLKIS